MPDELLASRCHVDRVERQRDLDDPNLQFDDTLLLIEPTAAAAYAADEISKAAAESNATRPAAEGDSKTPPLAGGPPQRPTPSVPLRSPGARRPPARSRSTAPWTSARQRRR